MFGSKLLSLGPFSSQCLALPLGPALHFSECTQSLTRLLGGLRIKRRKNPCQLPVWSSLDGSCRLSAGGCTSKRGHGHEGGRSLGPQLRELQLPLSQGSICQGADSQHRAGEAQGWLGAEQSPLTGGLCTTLVERATATLVVRAMDGKCFRALQQFPSQRNYLYLSHLELGKKKTKQPKPKNKSPTSKAGLILVQSEKKLHPKCDLVLTNVTR